MPRYGFHCDKCGHTREMKLTFSEYDVIRDNVVCECGETLKRDIESPSFQLNGGGWYRDNYNQFNTTSQLDKELKTYDETRSKNERGIFERDL